MDKIEVEVLSNDGEFTVRALLNKRYIKCVMETHPSMGEDHGIPENAKCIITVEGNDEPFPLATTYEALKFLL